MSNKWITHVKKYHSEHPNILYKQAMKDAKASYKKSQKGKGGGVSKPSDTTNPMPIIPPEQKPNLEQLQTEARRWARAHNNQIEAQQDHLQDRRDTLLTHIVREKRLPLHIRNKIDSFIQY